MKTPLECVLLTMGHIWKAVGNTKVKKVKKGQKYKVEDPS